MTLVGELRLFYPKRLHQSLSGIKNWHIPFEKCTKA